MCDVKTYTRPPRTIEAWCGCEGHTSTFGPTTGQKFVIVDTTVANTGHSPGSSPGAQRSYIFVRSMTMLVTGGTHSRSSNTYDGGRTHLVPFQYPEGVTVTLTDFQYPSRTTTFVVSKNTTFVSPVATCLVFVNTFTCRYVFTGSFLISKVLVDSCSADTPTADTGETCGSNDSSDTKSIPTRFNSTVLFIAVAPCAQFRRLALLSAEIPPNS